MMIFVCVSLFRPGVKMAEMAEGNDDGGFCLCFFASALSRMAEMAGGDDDYDISLCFFVSALSQNG